jgi:hypothetical protein
MMSAIKFNCQFNFTAVEIENKSLEWMLPSKSKTVKLLAPQPTPQQLLGIGHIAPQGSGGFKQRGRNEGWDE